MYRELQAALSPAPDGIPGLTGRVRWSELPPHAL